MINWLKKLKPLILVELFKKNDYDNKITEIDAKIRSITGLATTTGLYPFKIPDASDLVKKAEYDAKTWDIEKKYFATSVYNKFMSGILDLKIKEKELVNKSDTSGFTDNANLNKKIAILGTKAEL